MNLCDAAISFVFGQIFTCHKPSDHDQYQQNRWHRSIHNNLRVEWTDDHPEALKVSPSPADISSTSAEDAPAGATPRGQP